MNPSTQRDRESTCWNDDSTPSAASRIEREIDEHLELVPYINLGFDFDAGRCLSEATALIHRFVPYQSDPTFNITHWKGLALRALDGDATKAATNAPPSPDLDSRFATTDLALQCPYTLSILKDLLDWDHCHTVALLSLSPRSTIAPHVDDPSFEVMRSINLALNMPDGCEFVVDTRPDGSRGPFTSTVPFTPGSAMLVNVARNHYVTNRSLILRIHIVARGPLRMRPETVLERARQQNNLHDEDSVRAALDRRYATLGRASDHDPDPARYQRKRRVA